MSSPDADPRAVALEARAHGRDDLLEADALGDRDAVAEGATVPEVEQVKADSLDLDLLFEQHAPALEVSALVARALASAPRPVPADIAPDRGALIWAGGLAFAATFVLFALRAGSLLQLGAAHALLGAGLSLGAAGSAWVGTHVPYGWAGLGAVSAVLSALCAWPLLHRAGRRRAAGAVAGLLLALSLAGPGSARALDFEGEWPADEPGISLDVDGVSASEALSAAARARGLGLVAALPESPPVTVHVRDASLRAVVSAILGDADLVARREQGFLVVRHASGEGHGAAAPAEPGVEPAAAPGEATEPAPPTAVVAAPPAPAVAVAAPTVSAVPSTPAPPPVPTAPSASTVPERVSFGQDVHVRSGEVVRSVATFGGDARIEGQVLRDVATMGGDVEIAETGTVGGDVVSMGGDIELSPGATVGGSVVPMGGDVDGDVDGGGVTPAALGARGPRRWGFVGRALDSATDFGLLFLLGLLLMGGARARLGVMQRALLDRPVRCAVVGVLGVVATAFALVALTVSVLGIPAAVVLAVVAPAAMYAGVAVVASVVGAALPVPALRGRPVLGLAAGVVLLYVVSLVPVVGTLATLLVAAVGAGVVVETRFGKS